MARGRKTDWHHATNMYNSDMAYSRDVLRNLIARGEATADDVLDYLDDEQNRDKLIKENVQSIRETRKFMKDLRNGNL